MRIRAASCKDNFPNELKARFPVFNGFEEVDDEERGREAGDGGVGRTIALCVDGEGRLVATRDPEGTGSGAVRELRDGDDEGRDGAGEEGGAAPMRGCPLAEEGVPDPREKGP